MSGSDKGELITEENETTNDPNLQKWYDFTNHMHDIRSNWMLVKRWSEIDFDIPLLYPLLNRAFFWH